MKTKTLYRNLNLHENDVSFQNIVSSVKSLSFLGEADVFVTGKIKIPISTG